MRQLDRVLGSRVFFSAQRGQAFLRYVVAKSLVGSLPKEYEIAVEALGRDPDYDPSIDATVRVEASRLRSRLREYYQSAGADDPVLIDIPKGSYGAVFAWRNGGVDEKAALIAPQASDFPEPKASNLLVHQEPHHQNGRSRPVLKITVLALSGVMAVLAVWTMLHWRHAHEPVRSLAVLPLQNLSGDAAEDYFAEGMTDELTTELARIQGLRVVSRTSAVFASGSKRSLPQIAESLRVDAVVEGSVVRSGDEIRITAQLIDAKTDRHLWAQSFEGKAQDILQLQATVAEQIASQAQRTLLAPAHSAQLPHSLDPAAHDAYLRGRYFFEKQDWELSASYFRKAIAIDPSYAAAYSGLAAALDGYTTFHSSRPDEDMQQALQAVERAIQLDPNEGEAYTELGSIQTVYSWNWADAERNLLRGISLSPNSAIAEMKYSVYLDAVGRPEEAVKHMQRALDLDPLSFFMTRRLGVTLYLARRYREAIDTLHKAAEMEPDQSVSVDNWLRYAYEMQGNLDEAVLSDTAVLHGTRSSVDVASIDRIYHQHGWQAYWRSRVDASVPYMNEECEPYSMAMGEVRLKNLNRVFSLFNQAADQRCFEIVYLKTDPLLDSIRSDPRYTALLRRVSLSN